MGDGSQTLPVMHRITQTFPKPRVRDLEGAVIEELKAIGVSERIEQGHRVGITLGSRGIQNLVPILRTVACVVRDAGGDPRFVAAMGSHGGATEAGQARLLDSMGFTEAALGAPVVTCAESELVDHTSSGLPVYELRSALDLDGILPVNRIKAHTSFHGPVESGLIKELVVGLGGPKGAKHFHGFGPGQLPRLLREISDVILAKLPVLGGLAIIENGYEETALLKGVPADGMHDAEAELLTYSKTLLPHLPTDRLDVLIVQEMGKNFSGTGVDTNIIGRWRINGVPEMTSPEVQRLCVLDLSDASHGNANGLGLADFVTKALIDKVDRHITYLNCLTATFVQRAALPMWFDTERELFDAVLLSLSGFSPAELRVAVIPNTLHVADCWVSSSVAADLWERDGMAIAPHSERMSFDATGRLEQRI